ncbi:MAG: hypothetical protein MZU97_11930 [Bacillus subtilis]|nr:hypothetical protein [Bacillus subtilis]
MGVVGLGIQHQTGGFGFYINEEKVVAELEFKAGDARYREDLHDLLTYWKGRTHQRRGAARNMPESIREALGERPVAAPAPARLPDPAHGRGLRRFRQARADRASGSRGRKSLAYKAQAEPRAGTSELFEAMAGRPRPGRGGLRPLRGSRPGSSRPRSRTCRRRQELGRMAAGPRRASGPRARRPAGRPSSLPGSTASWRPSSSYGRLDEYAGDLYVRDLESGRHHRGRGRRPGRKLLPPHRPPGLRDRRPGHRRRLRPAQPGERGPVLPGRRSRPAGG